MRNLTKEFNNCIDMLDNINIDHGNITDVTVNTRAKKRWGQCKHHYVGRASDGRPVYNHSINISSVLLDERVPIESLQNTIIHEILHTCPGCNNHGPEWKRRASKVKRELGYDIKRCSSNEEKGVPNEIVQVRKQAKYIVRCNKCGQEIGRQRMSKIVERPSMFRCGICGGIFERIV